MLARLLLSAFLLLAAAMPASAAGIGVVLLHGKTGTPTQLAKLSAALAGAGYSVATPEMCWSKARIFDAALADCLKDVDAAIADLKAKGATAVVIGGTSQGAMAAIDYAVATPGLAGVIAMAPAADPNDASKFPDFAASIKAAEADVKAGRATIERRSRIWPMASRSRLTRGPRRSCPSTIPRVRSRPCAISRRC